VSSAKGIVHIHVAVYKWCVVGLAGARTYFHKQLIVRAALASAVSACRVTPRTAADDAFILAVLRANF